jgi:hypothetical protein
MIRDPSDGSVKEISPDANQINSVVVKSPSKEITSGLPPIGETELDRLNKWRAWLKDYFNPKGEQA